MKLIALNCAGLAGSDGHHNSLCKPLWGRQWWAGLINVTEHSRKMKFEQYHECHTTKIEQLWNTLVLQCFCHKQHYRSVFCCFLQSNKQKQKAKFDVNYLLKVRLAHLAVTNRVSRSLLRKWPLSCTVMYTALLISYFVSTWPQSSPHCIFFSLINISASH